MQNNNLNDQTSGPVQLPVVRFNGKSYFKDSRLKQYRNVMNPHDTLDFDVYTEIFAYTRAQALEDGVLADITPLAKEAGFIFPVAVTSRVFDLLNDTAQPGQSFEGRAWDLLTVLRFEIKKTKPGDIIHFAPYFNTRENQDVVAQMLYAKCHPGDHLEPVVTVMFPDED